MKDQVNNNVSERGPTKIFSLRKYRRALSSISEDPKYQHTARMRLNIRILA
jgi:hypothetical protein